MYILILFIVIINEKEFECLLIGEEINKLQIKNFVMIGLIFYVNII